MRSSAEYFSDLKRMKKNLYIGGERVGRDDPRIRPGINAMSVTFDLAQAPEYEELVTAISSLTGKKVTLPLFSSPLELCARKYTLGGVLRKVCAKCPHISAEIPAILILLQ